MKSAQPRFGVSADEDGDRHCIGPVQLFPTSSNLDRPRQTDTRLEQIGFPTGCFSIYIVNPSGEHTTLAVFTNVVYSIRRDDEVIHIDDVIGTSCYREGRIDPYQRIRYRAGQIRRVGRAVSPV